MPKLLVKKGEKRGQVYRLGEDEVSLGRDPFNNIVVPDRRASRAHARIFVEGEHYAIEDLGSVNGTTVNGNAVTKTMLAFKDEIQIGSTVLQFLSVDASEDISEERPTTSVKIIPDAKPEEVVTVKLKMDEEKVRPFDTELSKVETAEVTKAFQRLITLYRVSHEIGTVVELNSLLDKILELVLDIIKADRGFIMLIDDESGEMTLPVVRHRDKTEAKEEISISKTIIKQVCETGESVITSDAMQDERFKNAQSIILHDIRSTMCVPIKMKDKVLGIMHVDCKEKAVSFACDDLELLTAISHQAAVAISNAKLFEDLRNANKELKEQQAQLIEAEKMSALGRLAGGVAHEINNPMTSILGYSELLARKFGKGGLTEKDTEECAEFIKILEDEAHRCKNIAQTLLQFGRKQKTEMVPVEVNKIIEASLAVAQFHFKRAPIEIKKELDSGLPNITADKGQLQQVFLNFIINAKDAMESGGVLTILSKSRDDGRIEVMFRDTGCGIPQDKLEEIFKPLYTSKAEGKGTGLGLSISQDIIERHKGTIDVQSKVNEGTMFTIILPKNNL